MTHQFFDEYLASDFDISEIVITDNRIESGKIRPKGTKEWFPIINGIPRFLPSFQDNYTGNFGFQWKKFSKTQLDSYSGLSLSHDRFYDDTDWTKEELNGKRVLEVGSGSGRFTEVLLETGAIVHSFDYSEAVEANAKNHDHHSNLFLFQGSVYDIPYPDNYFDHVFCFGVLQHTPDPNESLRCMFKKLKTGGKLSVDNYPTAPKTVEKAKYPNARYREIRRVTSKWRPSVLFKVIQVYLWFWFPVDFLIRTRLPKKWSNLILYHLNIPCWNYVHTIKMPYKMLKQWAVLDTFDALSARFDIPVTKDEFEIMGNSLDPNSLNVKRAFNGYVLNLTK
ncbi:MAG: class I SAM-dependent methyltransferase [Flavobacteriales bacterium]|nr:class I SAM-dependent methyltransferase [Flavobacteriales bacterium]